MTNIVLIGMRGSGKSNLGFQIAKTMKRRFIDTDQEIEKQTHTKIRKLVEKKGWNYFRKTEKYVIRRVSKEKNAVISTGGGAIIDKENAKGLKKNGFVVYLKADLETLANRLEDDETRPTLTAHNNLKDELAAILKKREPIYLANADLTFEIVDDLNLEPKKDLKNKSKKLVLLLGEAKEEFKKPE